MSLENIIAGNAALVAQTTGQNTTITPPAAPIQSPLGTVPPVAAPVTAPAVPTAVAAGLVQPVGITLTAEQWAAYSQTQNRITELEAIERQRKADADATEIAALQAKGKVTEAFELQRTQARLEIEGERKKLKETEDRAKRYALDGELARALAAQPLVTGAVDQLAKLWRSEFSVEPQGDTFAVQAPGFQSVGSWIAAQLGRPEYAHFLRAQNPHGGTAGSGSVQSVQTAGAAAAVPAGPANLSEAVLLTMAAIEKSKADPRLTPTMQFGLRPVGRSG